MEHTERAYSCRVISSHNGALQEHKNMYGRYSLCTVASSSGRATPGTNGWYSWPLAGRLTSRLSERASCGSQETEPFAQIINQKSFRLSFCLEFKLFLLNLNLKLLSQSFSKWICQFKFIQAFLSFFRESLLKQLNQYPHLSGVLLNEDGPLWSFRTLQLSTWSLFFP